MNLQKFEEKIFKAMIVGVFLLGMGTMLPKKNSFHFLNNANAVELTKIKSSPIVLVIPTQRIVIIGKRLTKN